MLNMLGKPSLCYIKGVLSVLYVLKSAKRADFSTISGFVNLLMGEVEIISPKSRRQAQPT